MIKLMGIFFSLILSTTANSTLLYDSGEPSGTSLRCVAEGCLGSTEWWVISEFTADQDWDITGFEFFAKDNNGNNGNGDGAGIENYISTSWKIISADDPFGEALLSGTTVATTSTYDLNNLNVTSFLLSDLEILLASGTYYLAQHHDFSDESEYLVLESSYYSEYYHTDYVDREYEVNGTAAVKIIGTVPEPALFGLFGLALMGLSLSRKKKVA
ncbi:PEP-CTERM sorting domain-containing protein [Psychromonas sp. KJ10-2]|uniref:PEP-CTERM sorting domain-containing protein n=1 Tax=Psychromonas sp. KJ10-2 TaxID=3391822 RepID=UPI0039B63A76